MSKYIRSLFMEWRFNMYEDCKSDLKAKRGDRKQNLGSAVWLCARKGTWRSYRSSLKNKWMGESWTLVDLEKVYDKWIDLNDEICVDLELKVSFELC